MDVGLGRLVYGWRLRSRRRGSRRTRGRMRTEHRVGQRYRAQFGGVWIGQDIGIDKEHDPHINAFARPQMLLAEAKALELVEIDAGLGRSDIEGGGGGYRLGGLVDCTIEYLPLLARMHGDRILQRV